MGRGFLSKGDEHILKFTAEIVRRSSNALMRRTHFLVGDLYFGFLKPSPRQLVCCTFFGTPSPTPAAPSQRLNVGLRGS